MAFTAAAARSQGQNHTFVTRLPAKKQKSMYVIPSPILTPCQINPWHETSTIQNALILYVCVEKENLI